MNATTEKKNIIALMSPTVAKATAQARPDVQRLFKGNTVSCRSMSATDGVTQLDVNTLGPDDIIVGFSVPTNIVARVAKAIEIPIGKGEGTFNPRANANRNLEDTQLKQLIAALHETGRYALRGYAAQIVPALDHVEEPLTEEAAQDEITF